MSLGLTQRGQTWGHGPLGAGSLTLKHEQRAHTHVTCPEWAARGPGQVPGARRRVPGAGGRGRGADDSGRHLGGENILEPEMVMLG